MNINKYVITLVQTGYNAALTLVSNSHYQLIDDFGRTSHRIRARTVTAESREHDLRAERGLTILKTEEAYYAARPRLSGRRV